MDMLAKIIKDLKMNSRACLTGLLLTATSLSVSAGTITGSAHDFSVAGWNSTGEICVVCHTPHNADTSVTAAPLWNHVITSKTFVTYASDTLNATVGQPSGTSKLCLSCHDGTVALDSFGGSNGATFMTGSVAVGSDELDNDHPISFTYDQTLITADGALHALDSAANIGSGADVRNGTISSNLLFGGQVQCASCHDVHNKFTVGPTATNKLLRITNDGSTLCLTCHNK